MNRRGKGAALTNRLSCNNALHSHPSDQLPVGQHGAGSRQLRGRQVDLEMRKQVRGFGLDLALAQRGLNGLCHRIGAAAVEMVGQRGDVDADGGDGHGHDLGSNLRVIF